MAEPQGKVTKEMIGAAADVADVPIPDDLREAMLDGLNQSKKNYEEIYKLPYEKTRDNVLRFRDLAGDECEIFIVLVDHRGDPQHLADMRRYWSDQGLHAFMEYEIMNRGGALFVDHMQFEEYPQLAEARALLQANDIEAVCPTPFAFLFIGYDGQYYLCCSDWKKEVPLGHVADASFTDVMLAKLAHTRSRDAVCKTCK